MLKRKKDGGFTLIELMIVIAVIGILAVVLVPKMANVKDNAKATGVTTNAKSIEAFIVANIDKWTLDTNATDTTVINAINEKFGAGKEDKIQNPFTGETGDGAFVVTANPNPAQGIVTVQVSDFKKNGIIITGYAEPKAESENNPVEYNQVYTRTINAK